MTIRPTVTADQLRLISVRAAMGRTALPSDHVPRTVAQLTIRIAG
jgi:hypothetical protein